MSRLPALRGRDLTGTPRTLPDDLAGTPAVLLVGFAEAHQPFLDRWLDALAGRGLPVVEVPVAGPLDERFARFIEGGMVPGVPVERHAATVVVYTDRRALLAALGLPAPGPAAVALDAAGGVVAVRADEPRPVAVRALLGALAAAGGGGALTAG